MAATLDRDAEGNLIPQGGGDGGRIEGGTVRAGDTIGIDLPARRISR